MCIERFVCCCKKTVISTWSVQLLMGHLGNYNNKNNPTQFNELGCRLNIPAESL